MKTPKSSTFHVNVPRSPDERDPVELDSRRIFYVRSSHDVGAFRHTWDAYKVHPETRIVEVVWASGYRVELSGKDAHNFLKIARDRYAHTLFADD